MIAWISGQPQIIDNYLIIKTKNDLGYKVMVNNYVLKQIAPEKNIDLFIHAYIREDRFDLYGFLTEADWHLFELLISVSGCGPKTALGICEAGNQAVIEAVRQAQVSFFTHCPRVGKKLAQKLIIELKNKLGGLQDLDLTPKSPKFQDTKEALLVLGFEEMQIEKVLNQLSIEELEISEAVKLSLAQLKK